LPGLNGQVSAITITGAAGNGLGATNNDLRQSKSGAAGIGLGATLNDLLRKTSGSAVYSFGTTITYLRGAAGMGIDTGCNTKYLRRAARQRPGHHGHVPATKNVRRAVQKPGPTPETADVPLYYKRPAFALLCTCLLRQQAEQH
jgi:hypothetical protein